jgi:MATE family multidrug resistance protein
MIAELRGEIRPMLKLAAPLAMAELGWMTMGFVDTVMAGRVSAVALGAGSLGTTLFYPIAVCGAGLLLGLDTLVAQAFGAKDEAAGRRALIQGFWLVAGIAPVAIALLGLLIPLLRAHGVNREVMESLAPFLRALLWGVPSLLAGAACRRYLQARNIVRPITFAVVTANALNFAGDWLLMFGHGGAPRLGLRGSGISTAISFAYIALVLGGTVLREEARSGWKLFRMSWRADFPLMGRLLGLGFPSAMQILVEGAVFGVVTVLAAKLDAVSLAAHSIAVNVVSVAFMVPLGISSAAAVRVGQAVGRKDARGVAAAGWTALALGGGCMSVAALSLGFAPGWIARLYTPDAVVIAASAGLLRIAALFEIFDGFQVVATGALRGIGDTRTPALAHLFGYWMVGMPVAYWLCYVRGWGVKGIWTGLTTALILIGVILLGAWRRAERKEAGA